MKKYKKIPALVSAGCALALGSTLFCWALRASDHADGPVNASDTGTDIGDVYAFLDPNDNNRVVLSLTTRGFVVPGENVNMGIFDPTVVYRFNVETTGDAIADSQINVTFSRRVSTAVAQTATVQFVTSGNTVFSFTAPVTNSALTPTAPEQVVTTDPVSNVSFFAGLTDDPFFFDIPAFARFVASVQARAPNPAVFNRARDSFAGYNTMTIALSVPKALFANPTNIIGVQATTLRASRHVDPSLINVSNRGRVDAGQNALIGGFVISGISPKRVLIRGIGPSLAQFGVTGVLADPKLDVFDSKGLNIGSNNDWSATLATTFAQAGAFGLASGSKDAALVLTLQPGVYSAHVTSADATTGLGMVEVFDLNAAPYGSIDFSNLQPIDRAGIPAVNVALVPFSRKDEYNEGSTQDDAAGRFAPDIVATLKVLGTNDTNIGILAGLAVTKGDFLRLNLATPNTGTNSAGAFPNGRRLADDVIDTVLFFVANQNPLGDNVNANDVPFGNTFPFFAKAQQPRDSGVDDNTRN